MKERGKGEIREFWKLELETGERRDVVGCDVVEGWNSSLKGEYSCVRKSEGAGL